MSKPTLAEHIIGGFAFFVESGLTVDGITVAATAKPDNAPTTNWTDATLGDILNFEFGNESVDLAYMAPLASGGFGKINRKAVTQDYVVLQTRQIQELYFRLQGGLAAAIAEGAAQTPGTVLDRQIQGWLRIQGRALTGFDRFVMDWWCEARIEGKAKFENKVMEPQIRFTLIRAVNGSAVAGNAINYPAQS